jgi:hypothetical protein
MPNISKKNLGRGSGCLNALSLNCPLFVECAVSDLADAISPSVALQVVAESLLSPLQIAFTEDVVALENFPRAMSRDLHRRPLGHANSGEFASSSSVISITPLSSFLDRSESAFAGDDSSDRRRNLSSYEYFSIMPMPVAQTPRAQHRIPSAATELGSGVCKDCKPRTLVSKGFLPRAAVAIHCRH